MSFWYDPIMDLNPQPPNFGVNTAHSRKQQKKTNGNCALVCASTGFGTKIKHLENKKTQVQRRRLLFLFGLTLFLWMDSVFGAQCVLYLPLDANEVIWEVVFSQST